jgi:hemolysin III
MSDVIRDRPHYPTQSARVADLIIHVAGLTFAIVGGGVLIALSIGHEVGRFVAIAVYAVGMILMLSFSLAYNFSTGPRKPLLRRLDHAGIFVMIAGSYTPFTTQVLTGTWAWGMTIAVWTIASLGIIGKLFLPQLRDAIWITMYLALGWIVVIAAGPIFERLVPSAIVLLAVGGILYTAGVLFYVKENLTFSRPIWHGHVVAAAGFHWAAILIGTVLPALR